MSKQGNPFANFDFTKMMSEFKMPGVDLEALTEAQRKNAEAVTKANQVAFEGMQRLAQRQTQIVTEAMEEAARAAQALAGGESPDKKAAAQAELAQKALEKALVDVRELSEMMARSTTDTMDVINGRVAESMEELRKIMGSK